MCETFNVYAHGWYKHFITYTSDFFRYGIFTLHRGNMMPWINSRNLKKKKKQLGKHSRHFDLIEVESTCRVNFIFS